MRIPHRVAHDLALITAVIAFSFPIQLTDVSATEVPCETPPTQGKSTTSKQGATVNVMIDPTFTATQQQAIKDQLNKWKNSGGANVTFNFVEPSQAGGGATTGGPPILSIMRQVPTNLGPTAQGETRGFSYNGNRGDTFMDINPGVTEPSAFTQVMSHEIGHTFGLGECPTCGQFTSAMTLPASPDLNATGGHDGPKPPAIAIRSRRMDNIRYQRQRQRQLQNGAGSSSILVNGTKSGIRNNVGAMATHRGAIRREVRY